jgi:hypothetical protein
LAISSFITRLLNYGQISAHSFSLAAILRTTLLHQPPFRSSLPAFGGFVSPESAFDFAPEQFNSVFGTDHFSGRVIATIGLLDVLLPFCADLNHFTPDIVRLMPLCPPEDRMR